MLPKRRMVAAWTRGGACLAIGCLALACAGTRDAPRPSIEPPVADGGAEDAAVAGAVSESQGASLEAARQALSEAWAEVAAERLRGIALERRVLELEAARRAAAARLASLRAELDAIMDEVLRSKASMAGGSSRALAASRIAEVRAAVQAPGGEATGSASGGLARVAELLDRAEAEQAAANYSGAVYLAERANQLLRQTRLGESEPVALPPPPEIVAPLVPAELRAATQPANLRTGPGLDYERLVVLEVGELLRAVAQAGEWLQVERSDGTRGWVHARLVESR